ncbi:MAG: 1-deoxy-D-xylulose-5-phosphate reductoisomerase [Planctomycetota bacterium]|nr:MAG: 1-deoxy-D-xylulose-5-phosphate reductoisomerase [Planctomycetota bacterium]
MKKKIAILGSTGSIGRNACEVAKNLAADVEVTALCAGSNADVIAAQAREFKPSVLTLADDAARNSLDGKVPDETRIVEPDDFISAAFDSGVDVVINAFSGVRGLDASEATLLAGKVLALANKESLVAAGELLFSIKEKTGGDLIPIDSEHSAVLQAMLAGRHEEVTRIILTASGGPFRTRTDLENVTVTEALNHPTWPMGRKISIDSATLMNKALEIIEAHWFFGLPVEKIDVLIHPQSIIHGMVEFVDGSVVAQMGWPDMKLPIQYALTYPRRCPLPGRPLDLADVGKLEFEQVDRSRFPAVDLAGRVIAEGGTSGAAFNAANEVAVQAFLKGELKFTAITSGVAHVLEIHKVEPATGESVRAADAWARKEIAEWIAAR